MANANIATISLKDFSKEVLSATEEAIKTALEACGVQAVGYAVMYATQKGVVDTGLLRNSITYALGGEAPALQDFSASNTSTRKKSSSIKDRGSLKSGRYKGKAPADKKGNYSVYIGTNVYYAIYQEMGWTSTKGKKVPARPFLRPALEDHIETYKNLIIQCLQILGGK